MKKLKYQNLEMNAQPPIACDLNVGDEVIFTNDNGVEFFGYSVIGFSETVEYGRFIHLNTDSYWFASKRENLTSMSANEQMALLNANKRYSDMANLLKLSADKGLVALVNGYKIVWNSYLEHFSLSHDEIGVVDHNKDFDFLCKDAKKG